MDHDEEHRSAKPFNLVESKSDTDAWRRRRDNVLPKVGEMFKRRNHEWIRITTLDGRPPVFVNTITGKAYVRRSGRKTPAKK